MVSAIAILIGTCVFALYICIMVLMGLVKRKATFNLNEDTHQGLRLAAAAWKREMVEVVEAALGEYLGWNRMTKIEHDELTLYRTAEFNGQGRQTETAFNDLCKKLGYSPNDATVVAQLLEYLNTQGLLTVEPNDNRTGYKSFTSFPDGRNWLYQACAIRLQLTIPGRIRFQVLQAREEWESRQSFTTIQGAHVRQSRWNLNENDGRYAATNIVDSVIELDLGLKRADGTREPVGRFKLPLDELADDGFVTRRMVDGHRVFDVQIYRGQDGGYALGVRQGQTTPLTPYAMS
jgi:hypothetical protein